MTTLSEFKSLAVEARLVSLAKQGTYKRHALSVERKKRAVTISEEKKDLNGFNTSMNKLKVDFVTPQEQRKALYADYVKTIADTKATIKAKAEPHDLYIKERNSALKVIYALTDDATLEHDGLKTAEELPADSIDAWMVKVPKTK